VGTGASRCVRDKEYLTFSRSRGIALGPVHLAQAEHHGSSNLHNQTFPEEEKS
jgi:hypothetical protein